MASWNNWAPELAVAAPSASVPLIHQCVNRAARHFLRQTRAWQEWLEPTTVSGIALKDYSFDLPQGAELLRIERASLNGRPLALANTRDMQADPWQQSAQGRGAYLASTNLQDFAIGGAPGGGVVQVFVSLIPRLDSIALPDAVGALYHEAIRDGAKFELLSTRSADFYDANAAAVSLAFFRSAIDDACVDVWRSHTDRLSRSRVAWL